ncbi:phage terminase small subunit [Bacillus niacini]|uniref:Phage terminase small subunit n=1 Tax=Neobacillus niacini TaxID=86668 RepID=A0A852TER8_9BACI|nr:terminase small subunit [Neobacillus niacini]NYE07293.1 phage terminase small subunit [Neobacillus niacini]
MAKEKPTLNERQRLFVKYYIGTLNATESAKRAGYSPKTAAEIGYELLKKPHIAEAVSKGVEKKMTKADISAERILDELASIAFLTPEQLDALKSIKGGEKMRALELLGKYHTLFTDRIENTGEVTINVSLEDDEDEDNSNA